MRSALAGWLAAWLFFAGLPAPAVAADVQASNADLPKPLLIGIRPLAIPSSLFSETLLRDRILRAALARQGWKLQQQSFIAGSDLGQALQSGKLHIGFVGDVPALQAIAGGDFQAIAVTRHGFAAILARGQDTLARLEGRKIATVKGTSAHYILHEALTSAGLTEDDVELVDLPMSKMPAALASGDIDAFAAWEPFPTLARREHPDLGIIYRGLGNDYVLVQRSLAGRTPELVRLLAAALWRAELWWKKDPAHLARAAAWSIAASRTVAPGNPVPDTAEVIQITQRDAINIARLPQLPPADHHTTQRLQKRLRFLQQQGRISAAVSIEDMLRHFADDYLNAVLEAPRRYRIDDYDYDD